MFKMGGVLMVKRRILEFKGKELVFRGKNWC